MKKFTLIELLVVVAIIGILSSILLPAIGSARMKGIQAVCTSNLKQLSLATHMYLGDNSDYFMGNWKDNATFQDDSSWHYKLSSYIGLNPPGKSQYSEVTPNALHCPLEPQPYKDNSPRTYCSYKFTKRREQSLSTNPGVMVENSYVGKNAGTITNPTETVAATEELQGSYLNVVGSSTAESNDYNLFEGAIDYEPFLFPHKQNMMQVFWVDGHVKIVSRNFIFDTPENTSKANPKGTKWDSDR